MSAHPARNGLLDRLETLSREPAHLSRAAVLEILVDLFAARADGMSAAARETCLDLAAMVMRQVEPEACAAAVRRLVDSPAMPVQRLLAWAAGPIEIAAPVLRHARGLNSAHLLRLLVEASPEHLRAAAERDGLVADVADLILLRDDADAIGRMLRNRSASLSPAGFSALAARAVGDGELRAALVHRSDLPGAVVERLWPALDAPLKARLVASGWRYSMSEIGEVGREQTAATIDHLRSGSLPQSIDTYATLVRGGSTSLDDAMTEVLETGRLVDAAQLLARLLALPEGVALNLLYGVYDQGAAVLARRADLADTVVLRIVGARAKLAWVRATDLRRALAIRRTMSQEEAAGVLRELVLLWESGVANTGERRRFRLD